MPQEVYSSRANFKRGRSADGELDNSDTGRRKRPYQGEFHRGNETDEQPYKVLHRVQCNSSTHHIFKLFEDVPIRSSVGHLGGFEPLRHEEEHISRSSNLGFLVIKVHYCKPEDAGTDHYEHATVGYAKSSNHYSENGLIRIVSEELKKAMDHVSKAYIYANGSSEIRPPYLWIYHHRASLNAQARGRFSHESRNLHSIVQYAQDKYGTLYQKADEMKRKRVIDKETLGFLFRPNDLLVSRVNSSRVHDKAITERGFVLETWARFIDDEIQLNGWYFQHNSTESTRAVWVIELKIPHYELHIPRLSTYPVAFIAPSDRANMVSRGFRYWSYRIMQNVNYVGWDDKEELLLVRKQCR